MKGRWPITLMCQVLQVSASGYFRWDACTRGTGHGTRSFSVERHVRGKWACAKCQTLVQAAVPACIIDKGIATAGLMAHVAVTKYIDHQPLYRQEGRNNLLNLHS